MRRLPARATLILSLVFTFIRLVRASRTRIDVTGSHLHPTYPAPMPQPTRVAAPAPLAPTPTFELAPDATEIVSLRDRDAKFYRNPNGQKIAVFEKSEHFLNDQGQWQDVDLNFRQDGASYVSSREGALSYTIEVTHIGSS